MNRPQNFEEILTKFPDAKKNGDSWQASCLLPGHSTPEGHVTLKDAGDKALITCHGGKHTYQDFCIAWGYDNLTYSNNGHQPDTGQFVSEGMFDYVDEHGQTLFKVERQKNYTTGKKRFPQWAPDGKGGWICGTGCMKGVRRVLFNLPKVLNAIAEGQPVFFVEGEIHTVALGKLGFVATTSPEGAGKFLAHVDYTQSLKGVDLIILPDNDDAGVKHGQTVARACHGIADRVRMLTLPGLLPKGDIVDWLAAGGTADQLRELADACPTWMPAEDDEEQEEKPSKKKEEALEQSSFVAIDNLLYEQIFTDGKSQFISFDTNTGAIKLIDQITEKGIIPRQGEELSLGAIKLSTGTLEYGETLSLLLDINQFIERYVDLSASFRKFASYYVLLTWIYDRFHTLPYLRFIGDTGCGKSRALDTVGGICYKATIVSGCVTPAPIYRMLRRWQGTMILDEADLKNSDEYSEVVTILNCGFEKGRPVIRAQKDNPEKLQFLPTFGPKVFATRRRFKDAALEARCLTEIMSETARDDIPSVLTKAFFAEQEALRNKLLLFRLRNYNTIESEGPAMELHGVEPRLRQISSSFAALFAGQSDVLTDFRAFIYGHQKEIIEQRASTTVGRIVEKLLASFNPVTVVTAVTAVTEEVVIPVSSSDIAEQLGMRAQTVGGILKTLGLKTKPVRIDGSQKRCIIYDAQKFNTLSKRYILTEDTSENKPDPVTTVTAVTTVTGHRGEAHASPPEPPPDDDDVDGVHIDDLPEPPLTDDDDIEPEDSGDPDNDVEWTQPIEKAASVVSNNAQDSKEAGDNGTRETGLVASPEAYLELWENKGRPGVELRAGETCSDLRKALESEYLPRNIDALNQWYIENGGETAGEKPSAKLLEVSPPDDNNQDAYKEDIFGMTKEEALYLYEANGKPIIHLSSAPEVNCGNLEIFFNTLNDRNTEQIQAVVNWLKENAT